MGKLELFEIVFDHPNSMYMPGQQVTGRVSVHLNAAMKMKGIELTFSGRAKVHWTQRVKRRGRKGTKLVHYRAEENYFEQTIILYRAPFVENVDKPVHPPGIFQYLFVFQLPQELPSSFEGEWGNIRYITKATINKPWKQSNDCIKPFTVLSILDLNFDLNARNSQEAHEEKTLCCCCCRSGPISAVFRIDQTGYVPGEFIVLNGEINNNSRRTMDSSKVVLKMTVVFHSSAKSRPVTKEVAEVTKGEIPPGESEIWTGERLQVPSLPPSRLLNCRIIDILYQLVLIVKPSGVAYDMEVPLQVGIGTIPLRDVVAMYATPGFEPAMLPSGGAAGATASPPHTLDTEEKPSPSNFTDSIAPPPTYEAWASGQVNVNHEDQNEKEAPSHAYHEENEIHEEDISIKL